MKKKIYILNWSYNHRGEFDCGVKVYTAKEAAFDNLKACYNQSIFNITPKGKKNELDMDEFDEHGCYYIERYAADSWERGEVIEQVVEFEDATDVHDETTDDDYPNVEMLSGGYTKVLKV